MQSSGGVSLPDRKHALKWQKVYKCTWERTSTERRKQGEKSEESERRKAIKRTIGDGLNHIKNCSLCNFPFCFSTSISLFGCGWRRKEKRGKCKFAKNLISSLGWWKLESSSRWKNFRVEEKNLNPFCRFKRLRRGKFPLEWIRSNFLYVPLEEVCSKFKIIGTARSSYCIAKKFQMINQTLK